MALYDPLTGLPKRGGNQLQPDTDLTGQYGSPSLYGAGPSGGGGISPTGAASYAGLLNIPGTQPDFLGVLNADPLLQQFKSGLGAESIADKAQADAARAQAIIRFGAAPDQIQGDFLTPETRALAEQNTAEGLSTVARLRREFERVQQNIMDALAARGALRSGATGVALQDLSQEHKAAQYDSTQQLLDYLAGVASALTQSERQRAMMLSQEQAAAAGRIPADRLAGTPGMQAQHIGNGIYRSPDGRLWNQDGSPFQGAVPEPPPLAAQPPVSPLAGGGSAFVKAL